MYINTKLSTKESYGLIEKVSICLQFHKHTVHAAYTFVTVHMYVYMYHYVYMHFMYVYIFVCTNLGTHVAPLNVKSRLNNETNLQNNQQTYTQEGQANRTI